MFYKKKYITKKGTSAFKQGWYEIAGERKYFRSSWEYKYACYLQMLKNQGEIKHYEFEPHTFWFLKIMRGVRSYKPDFKVTYRDKEFDVMGKATEFDRVEWHEVKGWLDPKSKTKLKRMAKYYPNEVIVLRDSKWFKANQDTLNLAMSLNK